MADTYRGSKEYLLVYAELLQAARYRGLFTYPDVATIMGLPRSGSHMAREVGRLIGEISEDEVKNGRPMLSALVVSSVTFRPGDGFYYWARELGRLGAGEDKADFWDKEREAVYQAWK